MSIFKMRGKKSPKKDKRSGLIKYIETNSSVPPTGKVKIVSKGKVIVIDYFAPEPTKAILKAFVDTLKLPDVTKFWYERGKQD